MVAFDVLRNYASQGLCEHVLLFILEQTTLPMIDPDISRRGVRDAGVLLKLKVVEADTAPPTDAPARTLNHHGPRLLHMSHVARIENESGIHLVNQLNLLAEEYTFTRHNVLLVGKKKLLDLLRPYVDYRLLETADAHMAPGSFFALDSFIKQKRGIEEIEYVWMIDVDERNRCLYTMLFTNGFPFVIV